MSLAECTYHGDYNSPANWNGVCVAQASVPTGCPAYFIAPHGTAPESLAPTLPTGVTSTTALVDTVDESIATKDVYSCECAASVATVAFDRYTLTLAGAHEGDLIDFSATSSADEDRVTLGPMGPCPGPIWPDTFIELTACDLCPVDSGSGSGSGSGSSPTMPVSGCMSTSGSTGGATLLLVLAAFGLVRARSTRRDQGRATTSCEPS